MNPITLLQPPRVVFGNGCAPQCAEYLAQRGLKRVLLISSSHVLPAIDAVLRALKEHGVNLVQAQHDLAVAEFDLAQQVGRLVAAELKLPVQLYDPKKHYDAVRNKWVGFGSSGE